MHKNWITSLIIVSSLIPSLASAAIEISDGSVKVLYHLDSDSVDASGNGNNGTDSSISYSSGKLGTGAAGFSSASDSQIILNTQPVTGNPVTWSISYWFKTGTAARQAIFGFGDDSINWDSQQNEIQATSYKLRSNATATAGLDSTAGGYNDNAWHHVVISVNAGTGTFYIDNVSQGTYGSGNLRITASGSNNKCLGRDNACQTTNDFNGQLDEVVIFNTAIDSTLVGQLYNSGTGETVCTTTDCNATSTPATGSACTSDICQSNIEHIYLWLVVGTFILSFFGIKKLLGI